MSSRNKATAFETGRSLQSSACFLSLEKIPVRWDYPIMTVKADEKKRVVLPSAKPGDVFNIEFAGGKILLTKLVPNTSKLVRARRVKGIIMGAENVEIDSKEIVDAVRADREAR
jgi:hypothetical protein